MARYKKPLPGLTVIVSTRKRSDWYRNHIISTSGLGDRIEMIQVENPGNSLSSVYNEAANVAKYDHIVFMHDDLKMVSPDWGVRLLHHFQNTDYDIIGLAGVRKEMPANGCWWTKRENMVGIVNHRNHSGTYACTYSPEQGNAIEPVIVLDGLFIACNWKTVTHKWDESIPGFHFYDLGFTFPNYLEGHNIGVVTNIRVTHMSVGETNKQWEVNQQLFIGKYKDELPCIQ